MRRESAWGLEQVGKKKTFAVLKKVLNELGPGFVYRGGSDD
jgi:hypothetical protein